MPRYNLSLVKRDLYGAQYACNVMRLLAESIDTRKIFSPLDQLSASIVPPHNTRGSNMPISTLIMMMASQYLSDTRHLLSGGGYTFQLWRFLPGGLSIE